MNWLYNTVDGTFIYNRDSEDLNIYSERDAFYHQNPYVAMVANRISSVGAYLKLNQELAIFDWKIRQKIYLNLLIYGEAFIVGIKPVGMDRISKLEVLVHRDLTIQYDETSVFKEIRSVRYGTELFLPSEFLHISKPNPFTMYAKGLPQLQSAKYISKTSIYTDQYEMKTYENRGISGILSGTGEQILPQHEQDKINAQFQKDTVGLANANKIHMSQREVKFTPLNFKPSEMMATESSLAKLRIICGLFDVDSALFNDPAASTYNNVSEATKAFYNSAVLPLCDMVNLEVSNWLRSKGVKLEGDENLEVDYSDIDALRADAVKDADVKSKNMATRKVYIESLKLEVEAGFCTVEEAKMKIKEYDLKCENDD